METGNEIRSAVRNIRYYCEKVQELSKAQFNRDFDMGKLTGMNPEPGSVRFDCLGIIRSAANWIGVYCENIEANVKYAEELDEKLRPPPEEKEQGYEPAREEAVIQRHLDESAHF